MPTQTHIHKKTIPTYVVGRKLTEVVNEQLFVAYKILKITIV